MVPDTSSVVSPPRRACTLRKPMHSAQPLVLEPGDYDHEDVNDREHEQPSRARLRVAIELIDKEEHKGQDGGRVGPEPLL